MKRVVPCTFATVILFIGALGAAMLVADRTTPVQSSAQPPAFENAVVEVVPVRGNIYMIVGEGGNITVQLGPDGVLLVDTQYTTLAERNLAALRTLSDAPIEYLINTHGHSDHVGGNAYFRISTQRVSSSYRLRVVAHDNALKHMQEAGFSSEWWPTELYSTEAMSLSFNGERLTLLHQPAAHTSGDSIVVFEQSRVISGGDIYNGMMYPFIDRWKGGSLDGLLAGLDRLVDLMTPTGPDAEEVLLIPGHGNVAARDEVAAYRDVIRTIVARVESMVAMGMSLEQIRAAGPTREFDARYGSATGGWTTAQFVESIYVDLQKR